MTNKFNKVTIIGGNGFIGTNLISKLMTEGFLISVLVRDREKAKNLWPLPNVDIIEYSNSLTSIKNCLPDSELLINLVGVLQSKVGKPWGPEFNEAHVELASNIVEATKESCYKKIIHISALGSSENGPSMYLRSKAEGEKIFLSSNLKIIILRPSVVFGPGDKFLSMFADMHRFLPFIPLAAYQSLYQPLYIGDLTKIIQACIERNESSNTIYECVGPDIYSLGDLVLLSGIISKRKKPVIPLPNSISRIQAYIMEKLPGPTILSRDNLDSASIPNISKDSHNVYPISNPTSIKSILSDYSHIR